jgi:hypothetical protein
MWRKTKMRIRYSATHRCKQTGRRYRVLGIRKWENRIICATDF